MYRGEIKTRDIYCEFNLINYLNAIKSVELRIRFLNYILKTLS